MKSEILRDEIIIKIKDYLTATKDYENYKFKESMEGMCFNSSFEDSYALEQNNLSSEISKLLLLLHKNAIEDKFYFFDCPFSVYKANFTKRLNAYSHKYIDGNIFEFLKEELHIFNNPSIYRILNNELLDVNYNDFTYLMKEFEFSLIKKTKFLIEDIESMGYLVEKLPDEEIQVDANNFEIQPGAYKFTFKFKKDNIVKLDSDTNNNSNSGPEKPSIYKAFIDEYLIIFSNVMQDYKAIQENSFIQTYNLSITHFTPYLKEEILNNIMILDDSKKTTYLSYLLNYIENKIDVNYKASIDREIEKYKLKLEDFPYFNKGEFYNKLNTYTRSNHISIPERIEIEDLQLLFFEYATKLEVEKIIDFINELKDENKSEKSEVNMNNINKDSKQLTSNQIVLLFQKIGFFSNPSIESSSKIKQAKFISLITGLNEKNIKTNIAKLDNSPKKNGEKYSKDIDITDMIFNDLIL